MNVGYYGFVLKIKLFGEFEVIRDDVKLKLPMPVKRLLAFLVLNYESETPRARLATFLGVENRRLRRILFECRNSLGDQDGSILPKDTEHIKIDIPDDVTVDYCNFDQHLRNMDGSDRESSERFLLAAKLYREPLLTAGWSSLQHDKWVNTAKRTTQEEFWEALESLGPERFKHLATSLRAEAFVYPLVTAFVAHVQGEAIPGLKRPEDILVKFWDALCFRHRRKVMNLLLAVLGNALHKAGKQSRWNPDVLTRRVPPDTLQAPVPSSRRPIDDLLPPEAVLNKLLDFITDSRVTTLLGPPGMGKSSLAQLAMARLYGEFQHGVWFVDLEEWHPGELKDVDTVAKKIVREMKEVCQTNYLEHLKRVYRDRVWLLILDGCESALGACHAVVSSLAKACSELKVLITSRETLNVAFERPFRVPPFILPPASLANDWNVLLQYSCIQLFLRTAERIGKRLEQTSANAALIIRICQLCEGVPFEIVRAAASLINYSLDQIVHDVEQPGFGMNDEDPRRRSVMRSWNQLPPPCRLLLPRLAVFGERFSEESVIAICPDAVLTSREIRSSMMRLTAVSLLTPTGTDGRYGMLPTIRRFAFDQLAQQGDELERLSKLHCQYFAQIAAKIGVGIMGPQMIELLSQADAEMSNLERALGWSVDRADRKGLDSAKIGLEIACSFWPFWVARGRVNEGRKWFEMLEPKVQRISKETKARMLVGLGSLAYFASDYASAIDFSHRGSQLASHLGNHELQLTGTSTEAAALAFSGRMKEGLALLDEASQSKLLTKDSWLHALVLGSRTMLQAMTISGAPINPKGAAERLIRDSESATALARETGNPWILSQTLGYQAIVKRVLATDNTGKVIEALMKEALNLHNKIGDRWGVIQSVVMLALLAHAIGSQPKLRRAAVLLGGGSVLVSRQDWVPVAGVVREEYEFVLTDLEARLGSKVFRKSLEYGASLSLAELVPFALSDRTNIPHCR
jgi:predicted ATPase